MEHEVSRSIEVGVIKVNSGDPWMDILTIAIVIILIFGCKLLYNRFKK